jgi:hypothetical protein
MQPQSQLDREEEGAVGGEEEGAVVEGEAEGEEALQVLW